MISQSNTPGMPAIPGTKTEIKSMQLVLDKHNISYTAMEDQEATLEAVLVGLKSNASVHLACHAIQDTREPLRSGFYLHDGRLELAEIMKKPLPRAQLAFLSACQTSAGDESLSEEAVHLAAGMLAAGYRGVVATMWSIQDKYGPIVAKDFYDSLLSGALGEEGEDAGRGDDGLDSTGGARSLHFATKRLRNSLGTSEASFLAWVPYVHIGF